MSYVSLGDILGNQVEVDTNNGMLKGLDAAVAHAGYDQSTVNLARAMNKTAEGFEMQGNHNAALRLYDSAIRVVAAGQVWLMAIQYMINLALLYKKLKQMPMALEIYSNAKEMLEGISVDIRDEDDHTRAVRERTCATLYSNLARLHDELGNSTKASQLATRAIEYLKKFPDEQELMAICQRML